MALNGTGLPRHAGGFTMNLVPPAHTSLGPTMSSVLTSTARMDARTSPAVSWPGHP